MARKSLPITIDAEGRDKGKAFIVREMSARQAEWWGARLLSAMARSGVDIPDDIAGAGMAGVAAVGIKFVLASFGMSEVKPLLDEMFDTCITVVPDPHRPEVTRGAGGVGPLTDDDIEELATLARLRREALMLHLDFLPPAARSILTGMLGAGPSLPTT